jgi:hypothetical protein
MYVSADGEIGWDNYLRALFSLPTRPIRSRGE